MVMAADNPSPGADGFGPGGRPAAVGGRGNLVVEPGGSGQGTEGALTLGLSPECVLEATVPRASAAPGQGPAP